MSTTGPVLNGRGTTPAEPGPCPVGIALSVCGTEAGGAATAVRAGARP